MLIYQNNVLDFFDNLTFKLFDLEYFGFVESSETYVNKIIDFIYENHEIFPSRITPTEIKSLGSNYIFYKIIPRTTWFFFFEKKAAIFLVTNIINNHCKEAKFL